MISQSFEVDQEVDEAPHETVSLPHAESSTAAIGDAERRRSVWGRQLDFFLSCVGYAVGLGNIWRFPYLCYISGGGAFLVPYFFFLAVCGMPTYFLEMSLGQFGSRGPIDVWKISPLFQGIGYGMAIVSAVVSVYYNVIIAWALYYLYWSYSVPWSSCNNSWNTANCTSNEMAYTGSNSSFVLTGNGERNYSHFNSSGEFLSNNSLMSSSEEFWLYKVLQQSSGIDVLGSFQPSLVLTLSIAWLLVYLCVSKGVKSSGKVVYVTATFPYVVLLCLLLRGLTMPGAYEGVIFYLYPDWKKLLNFKVWGDAATQIFFSGGFGWGALLTMSSYNKFNNNVHRDSMIVPIINCITSILAGLVIFSVIGVMAYESGKNIEDVASQGPGLAFIVYPEAILRLPVAPLWAILFFLMLLAVGLDTQFGMVETAVSASIDLMPDRLKKRKMLLSAVLCCFLFILGLPCVTEGGVYVVQLLDWYAAAFSLMIIALLENIAVAWIYGVDRFLLDISLMTKKTPSKWWKLCWMYITPLTIIALLIFIIFTHSSITYNDYVYPSWSVAVGWLIAICSIAPIPLVAVLKLLKAKGNFKRRLVESLYPSSDWGPALEEHKIQYKESLNMQPSCYLLKKGNYVMGCAHADIQDIDSGVASDTTVLERETVL